MKVFVPRQVVWLSSMKPTTHGLPYSIGIPLEGSWETVPDYFRQVTKGNKENACVHAKLVAGRGLTISSADMYVGTMWFPASVKGDKQVSISTWGLYGYIDATVVGYTRKIETQYRLPKNYRGHKPVLPRKYHRSVYTSYPLSVSARRWDGGSKGNYSGFQLHIRIVTGRRTYSRRDQARVLDVEFSSTQRKVSNWTASELRPLAASLLKQLQSRWNPDEKQDDAARERMAWFAVEYVRAHAHEISVALADRTGGTWLDVVDCSGKIPEVPENLRTAFLLNEDYIIGERLDPYLFGRAGSLQNYWRGWLVEHALKEACESFPKLSDNSIQNILEVAGFIKALVVDHRIEIPKSLSEGWLAYRYQYSTTKMDVNEAIRYVHRRMDLGDLDQGISCYGHAQTTFKDVDITCQCRVKIRPKNVGYLAKIWRALDEYGLTPDFYVIWDMVPYSFMVDWFLPIGDLADVTDASYKFFSGEYYEIEKPVYSLSYTRALDSQDVLSGHQVKCYSRWEGVVPTSLNLTYWFDAPSAESKTVWYRVLDAASMFIGRG